jgi:hypothetical protein
MSFRIKTNHENPPNNLMIFEEYFGENFTEQDQIERQYIPVYWTNYYIEKNYGQADMSDLQQFLNSLDRSKKYFTIVQWDDGILNNVSDLDLLVFASGGVGDIPIPLNSSFNIDNNRFISFDNLKMLYSFVGSINGRHAVRETMSQKIISDEGYIADVRLPYYTYLDIMRHSLFSLCPRGYGKTSFRIYEALMCKSIPVYIYDDPWIPYSDILSFEEYGVLCHISEIESLLDKLKSFSPSELKQKRFVGKKIFDEYFTHTAIYKNIIRILQNDL